MAKLRLNGDTSGYMDVTVPDVADSSSVDLAQVPQLDEVNVFTQNVGIGDTSPSYHLDVNNNSGEAWIRADGSTNAGVRYAQGGTNKYVFYHESTDNSMRLFDNTSNELRMHITANGHVRTPSQPAFFAYPSSTVTVSAGNNKFTFDSTRYNTGGHYSTSTGRFTAPVSGIYEFTGQVYYYPGTTGGGYHGFTLLINGSMYYAGYNNGGYGDTTWGATTSAYMSAGDYIEFYTYPIASFNLNGGGGSVGSYFTGHLIG